MTRQRIGWGRGPTEQEAEATDRTMPPEVDAPGSHDTPPLADVLQAEDPERLAVPVFLVNPVNVNQLPTRLTGMFSRALIAHVAGAADAVRVLPADPRRAAVTISSNGIVLAVGRSQGEANDADAYRIDTNQGPYRFHFTDAVWIRSDGAAARVSIAVEAWSR